MKIEKIKIDSKKYKHKLKKGWKIKIDKESALHVWYKKPVDLLPDELFEI